MNFDGFDDELWDEHKWEAHLDEVERKSDQLRRFISSDPKGNIPRWITLLQESQDEDDAFEAYVEEELLLDEAYFPEEEDDWDDEDDYDDEDFLFGAQDEFDELEEMDDFDSGEEWKALSEDFASSDYGSLDNLLIFNRSRELAVDVLKWAESVDEKYQTKSFQEFVGETLKIGAKLAGGYSFGFEPEYIGANIAYTKKALKCSNLALALLQAQRSEEYFNASDYGDFHERIFELRNDVGVYVQELRDRFYNRMD
ncbi:MAG: hypothetical protein JJ966_11610 [Balneolaceae bacterium]|nr:hypothetical protein [Balneolaceae bacterium]